jgi:hypothetical protein
MHILDKTAWEILNATADDSENLEQIYLQIGFEFSPGDQGNQNKGNYCYRPAKGAPLLSEVADRIRRLVEMGFLAPEMDENGSPLPEVGDLSYVWRAWFRMTAAGRIVWESSPHANLLEQEKAR